MTRKIVKRSIFFFLEPTIQSNPSTHHYSPPPPPTTSPIEKPKIDIYQYFVGVDGLGKDPRHPTEPSAPTTIGAARKTALAKDIDPTVLKVNEKIL